eukprot:Polyplicarium_translucidae@DN3345_c4_g1_i5.p2
MLTLVTVGAVLGALAVAVESPCPVVFDVVFVQDTKQSHISFLKSYFSNALDYYVGDHPGSRTGVAWFSDSPSDPLGGDADTCGFLAQPLSSSRSDAETAYDAIVETDSGDAEQSQLLAVQEVLLNPTTGWREKGASVDGVPVVSVVLLVTDSYYHTEGDGALGGIMTPNDGTFPVECGVEDYPSLGQVADAFNLHDAYFAVLIAGGSKRATYENLIETTVGVGKGFTEVITQYEDSMPYLSYFTRDVLKQIASAFCARPPLTTTSEAPTT